MSTTIKKIIIASLCFTVLSGGLIAPQKTYAVAVVDAPLTSLTAANFAETVAQWATEFKRWVSDNLAKTLRDKLVKAFVDKINQETVKWIKCAGKSTCDKPSFVTDWKKFMKDAGRDAVNQTISESKLADLCTPFAAQLRIALIPIEAPVNQTAKCTLEMIQANARGFYQNFQNGGWIAFGEGMKPENDFYMQLVIFGDDAKTKASASEEAKSKESAAGSGFLSVSTCEEDNYDELYGECFANYSAGGETDTAVIADACSAYAEGSKTCLRNKVQTPGDAVAGTVRNMIGADNQFMSGVQSVLTVAINAGINRLMTEGMGLLDMYTENDTSSPFTVPSDLQDEIDSHNGGSASRFKEMLNPTYKQWRELLNIKLDSQSANTRYITNLGDIQGYQFGGTQCPPEVTGDEIGQADAVAGSLEDDIRLLGSKMADAERIIQMIDAMDPNDTAQTDLITAEITAFNETYSAESTYGAFTDAKTSATDEQAGINSRESASSAQLTVCQDAQAGLETPAETPTE